MLYRIVSLDEFRVLERDGLFSGSPHDVSDGFIHLSAAHQVSGTLATHYAGRTDLVLLSIRSDRLLYAPEQRLEWEISRGGDRFPHLYGTLPARAIVKAVPLALDAGGRHVVPNFDD